MPPVEELDPSPTDRSLDAAAQVISILADYGFVVALFESIAVARRARRPAMAAVRLAILGISIFVLNTALKSRVDRPRPEGAELAPGLVRRPSSSSFPSGHVMAATASAVALPETALGVGTGLLGAGLVGWSRLHLGAHHAGDVAGGVLIGGLLGAVLRPALRQLANR